MLLTPFIFTLVCFVAYANGANDNFKGVASLFGSRTCRYRTAISWATFTTIAGSIASMFVARILLKRFSGHGLVPEALTASPHFILAIASGAGATVILAALLGFPISTTHSLTGALVGAGLVAVGSQVNVPVLTKSFVTPLLASPLLAMGFGATVYLLFHFTRLWLGVTKETCLCAAVEEQIIPILQPGGVSATQALPKVSITSDASVCFQRYTGVVFGISAGKLLDAMHFLSAGAVSFARGFNDTPKIVALLLVVKGLSIRWGFMAVTIGIAIGGLLSAKRVAETMSRKLTDMNAGQGFAANLSTALLVTTASFSGLPVSTTHVSVGSLLGMGVVTRQAKWKPVFGVIASWVITLPCAAILAALTYWLAR